jgi:multiple sugar transport system substrate-binding protein
MIDGRCSLRGRPELDCRPVNHRRPVGLFLCFFCLCWLGTARAEHTVIEILHYFAVPDQEQALKEVVAAFEEKNPDIEVRLTYVPFGDLLARTLQTVAARRPPAIAALDNPDVLRAAKAGVLADISGWLSDFPGWPDLYEGARSAVSDGDHVYGIPIGSNNVALFYNKKMFSDVGIQEPPRTWDELIDVSKKLTKNPVYGFAFPAVNTEDCTGIWETFLWSNGGSLLHLNSDRAQQALKLWVDLVRNGSAPHDVVDWGGGEVTSQFFGGNAAMIVSGPWILPSVKRSGVEYGIAPVPLPKAGATPVTPLGGEVWCVVKNDKKIEEAAVKFVAFTQERERLLKFCVTANYISSVRDVARKQGEMQADLKPFIAQMQTARTRTTEGGADYPRVSQIARVAIQRALIGQSSVQAALDDAAKQIEKLGLQR